MKHVKFKTECPACLESFTHASSHRHEHTFKPGVLCVCMNCGELLRLDAGMSATLLSEEEYNALPRDVRRQHARDKAIIGTMAMAKIPIEKRRPQ